MRIATRRLAWSALKTVAKASGLLFVFDKLNHRAARVLTYHGVTSEPEGFTGTDFSEAALEKQIAFLKRHYKVVPIGKLQGAPGEIAVSFDDGNLSDLRRVAPILHAHGIRGTFFVCSDLVLGRRSWTWTDEAWLTGFSSEKGALGLAQRCKAAAEFAERFEHSVRSTRLADPYSLLGLMQRELGVTHEMLRIAANIDSVRFSPMNAAELRALAEQGHEIGCHTASHPILAFLADDADACTRELRNSREDLERIIGSEVRTISYPFGRAEDVGPQIIVAAKAAGYERGLLNMWTHSADYLSAGRIQAPNSDLNSLHAETSGFRQFLRTGSLL